MTNKVSRRRWLALVGAALLVVLSISGFFAFRVLTAHANPASGAAFTTVNEAVDGSGHCQNGNPQVNCNIYDGKQYVWLSGGPSSASLSDGTYFFAVLDPGSQLDPNDGSAGNLSSPNDAYTNRTFSIAGGAISYSGSHDFADNLIRLMPYNDTDNPGGVYILAICSLGANGNMYPVSPSDCKYDAFKIHTSSTAPTAYAPTITKTASGAYTNTYAWNIQKAVDKTIVKQVGGTATFNYTVTVSHDNGTISGVHVTGAIQVYNANTDDSGNTLPVQIDGVTDQLSDGTTCAVTNGGAQTLTQFETDVSYTCDLSALPTGELDNTATVNWSGQTLSNGATLDGGSTSFVFSSISFTPTVVNNCVAVTDNFNGTTTTLGSICVGDANPNPTTYTYAHTIAVPQYGCVAYNNTATYTTNTTGATGSASQSVQVCGPIKTGALTMGFWHNKNGQGIITSTASAAGVCNLTPWLRQFAPFQDLSATASCAKVASYQLSVFNAANAGGASMNAMLKSQMLATALDVYYSNPSLGGNKIGAPSPIGGVAIDLTKVCAMIDGSGGSATCGGGSYENVSAAFGGASSMTISQALSYAASQSNAGGSVWYGQVKATQALAKDLFDAINNQVVFAA